MRAHVSGVERIRASVSTPAQDVRSDLTGLEANTSGLREATREQIANRARVPTPSEIPLSIALEVRSGATRDDILSGSKILVHTPRGAPEDPLVHEVQTRLRAAGITEANGKELKVDGRFGETTAAAIALYRGKETLEQGSSIDATLLRQLMPQGIERTKASPQPNAETKELHSGALENAATILKELSPYQRNALTRKLETLTGTRTAATQLVAITKELGIDLSTTSGIEKFQTERGLKVDGDMGPATARSVAEVVSAEWLKRCVTQQGPSHEWRAGINEINVVGLRGWSPETGQNANTHNLWNDTIAMVWTDPQGLIRFKEFRATCDPGIKRNSKAPDVNGDGRGDVGHIAPGQYLFKHGYYKGRAGFGVPAEGKAVNVYRDTSGDGKIGTEDKSGPIKRLWDRFSSYFGNDTFKFHGLRDSCDPDKLTVVGGASAGCQVPKVTLNEFKREISPLLAANPGNFPYTLIDLSTNHQHASTLSRQFAEALGKPIAQK